MNSATASSPGLLQQRPFVLFWLARLAWSAVGALLLGKDIGNQIVEKARLMQPDGLLLNAARPNLLRFMPALNVTTEEIDQMMAMLRSILDTL